MKYAIKAIIITLFVVIISRQVISLAAKPSLDYDKYERKMEQIQAKLIQASYAEAIIEMRDLEAGEEGKEKAKVILNKMIEEYEGLKHNPEQRQKAMEEIAVLTYKIEDYESALEKAEDTLSEYPKSLAGSTILAMCRHFNAQKFIRENNYDLAIAEYKEILGQPVSDGLNAFANYFIARTYEKKSDKDMAEEYYLKIIEKFPELDWKERAKKKLEKNDEK